MVWGCMRAPPRSRRTQHERELATLLAFEQQRRAATDFAALPPSEVVLGPDPYRIAALRGGGGWSACCAASRPWSCSTRRRGARPRRGAAVAGRARGVGRRRRAAWSARPRASWRVYRSRAGRSASSASRRLPVDALGMRDVALAPDGRTAYVVEDREGRLLAVSLERARGARCARPACASWRAATGRSRSRRSRGYVAVNCLLDHTIEIRRDGGELARIHHDGPIWSFALHRERRRRPARSPPAASRTIRSSARTAASATSTRTSISTGSRPARRSRRGSRRSTPRRSAWSRPSGSRSAAPTQAPCR